MMNPIETPPEILSYFLEDFEANGKKVPSPRTLEQIKAEQADWAEWG